MSEQSLIISGQDEFVGEFTESPLITYQVTEEGPITGTSIAITESVNDTPFRTILNAIKGQEYVAEIPQELFWQLSNNENYLKINATDGTYSTTRVYTFIRKIERIDVQTVPEATLRRVRYITVELQWNSMPVPITLGDLPLGSLVKDDSSRYYGEPIIWRIADKNHNGYPINSVTLITDKVIKLAGFDGKEPGNANADRVKYGSGRYRTSNIRQWLNSEGPAGSWWTAQNLTDGTTNTNNKDAPPSVENMNNSYNPYNTEAGFKTNFSEKFKDNILPTTLRTAKNTVTDKGGSEIVVDDIFLASRPEVGGAIENYINEGSVFPIFSDNTSRLAYPTDTAIANNDFISININVEKPISWFTRTPRTTDSSVIYFVNNTGIEYAVSSTYNSIVGIRPLCNLISDILVSPEPDTNGVYTLFHTPPEHETIIVEVSNNALDDEPIWEPANVGLTHEFTNIQKTNPRWAIAVRVIIEPGEMKTVSLSEIKYTYK